jgi:hypothetical protein
MSGGIGKERRAAIMREVDQRRLRAGRPGLCVLCGGQYQRGERVIQVPGYGIEPDVAHRRCAIKAAMANETEE